MAIAVALGLIAVVVGTLGWWHWGFVLLASVGITAAAWELIHALRRIGMTPAAGPLLVGSPTVLLVSYGVTRLTGDPPLGIAVTLGTLALTAVAVLLWRMRGGVQSFVADAAASMLVLVYVPLLGSSFALLMAEPAGNLRIISLILVNTANDTGAYAVGSLIGRHKMTPRISPNKTWEGLAGGITLAVLVGTAAAWWILDADWWVGAVLGLLVATFGTAGDLVESIIKRDAGLKDMSSLLPGHGGVLDRVDSLLVAAPVAWFALHLMLGAG